MFRDIVDIFHSIKNESSKTGKEAIIRANKDNMDFVKVLRFLYNPFELTGLKAKKLVKFADFTSKDVKQFDTVLEAIDYIIVNNTGRDLDAMIISNLINTYDTDKHSPVHDFLQDLFTKDFKCGITATTINKVFGKNFIPKFEVMLAKKFEDEQHKIKSEFGITLKLDGIRCVVIKEENSIKFFTRAGQPIEGLIEIEKEFKDYPNNRVYDGELLLIDDTDMSSDDLFRATQKVVRKDGEKKNISFYMFDSLPLEEFKNGKSSKTYKDRRKDLVGFLDKYQQFFIRTLPLLYWGTDKSKIAEFLNEAIANGKEGIMINNGSGYYVTKRSDNLLKVKVMNTVDLKVTGFEEGTGKYEGKLGSLIVDYKGYSVGVGSGFTDFDREAFWEMRESMLGLIVEIQYFEESNNQDGGISLRFPVFKQVRYDKDEPSLN